MAYERQDDGHREKQEGIQTLTPVRTTVMRSALAVRIDTRCP